jgi:hypothetical protein
MKTGKDYKEAVEWVALNDELALVALNAIAKTTAVMALAALFGYEPRGIAFDVMAARIRLQNEKTTPLRLPQSSP